MIITCCLSWCKDPEAEDPGPGFAVVQWHNVGDDGRRVEFGQRPVLASKTQEEQEEETEERWEMGAQLKETNGRNQQSKRGGSCVQG